MIIKNAIKCRKCGDVIESTSTHDFKICSCGACAVDGGHEYLRRSATYCFIQLIVAHMCGRKLGILFCLSVRRLLQ